MQIDIADLQSLYHLKKSDIRSTLKKVLSRLKKDAELSIVLVDDDKIKELHRLYLGINSATDVLTFPLDDLINDSKEKICGEIIVSVETAIKVASDMSSNIDAEIYLYLVHGILHLTGYDDKDTHMAKQMHDEEMKILNELGMAVDIDIDRGL